MPEAVKTHGTAEYWMARAYELEDALVRIKVGDWTGEQAGKIALDAINRFERTVAGGEDDES